MKRTIAISALALGTSCLGIALAAEPAQASAMFPSIEELLDDVLVEAGLTGGKNGAAIVKVVDKGSITFNSGIGGGKVGLTNASPPRVDAKISCSRDGYRPSQLGTQKWSAKSLRNATQTASVYSKLALDVNEEKVWWDLHEACVEGKTAVLLPVTIPGNCQNVKAVTGPANQVVTAPMKLASFKLSCNMYDAATIAKCAGGGCG